MDGASATIEVLVQNLIDLSKEEIALIRGLEKNADKLKSTLATIQSLLDDAQKKFITDDAVRRWLKDLQDVAFDADNVLDELNYHHLSNTMKKKAASCYCFPSFNHCIHRRNMAVRINEINSSFESIRKNAVEVGLEGRLADAPAADHDAASETDSFAVDPIFIGRDDDVCKLVDMLATPTEQALSVLPIVGMGGLGKTTLVRKVFNHEKTKTCFGLHIWVHVSESFDVVILLKKILAKLKPGNVEDESREGLLKKILEALGSKTYLLVLDDVWNQDQQKWDDFMNSWSGITSSKGNQILVTTRSAEVASIVRTGDVHLLNGLSEEECWSIIKNRAFKAGDVPPGFEAIGRSIAARCGGLPLAANVVGGVLRDKSRDEWLSIEENWLSDAGGDENNISKILKLSFDRLPSSSLKKCFSYCSIFPKGLWIEKQELIELWMAEGFLQPSQTCDMENVGSKNVNFLLQNSLLQVGERDEYGNVRFCSMHDLVHDLASSVSGSSNTSDGISRARYIRWEWSGDEASSVPKEQAKWLRTLFYKDANFEFIPSHFKSLHTLTLIDTCVGELPESIKELIHLRYLNVSMTKVSIEYLPDSIGELYHLQTLKADPRKLPKTVKCLFNLRHLHVPDYTRLPAQMGMLTSLQTLPYFKVRDREGHRIVELGSLKNLKGEIKICNLERVKGEEESKKADLSQKKGITKLELEWNESRYGEINDEDVLKGLQPHPNLKSLHIFRFKGSSFPSWTLKMVGLTNLMEIKLSSCVECEEIPTLGHLPLLKSLYLSELRNVRSIGSSFYGSISSAGVVHQDETILVFPSLESLELWSMPNLTEWAEVEIPSGAKVKVFPCLQYLTIVLCNQLKSAPSQFTSLKELYIDGMDNELPLANICSTNLNTLKQLNISELEGQTSLPDLLFHNNQHLSSLVIENCPNLRELSDGLHNLNSLEELRIRGCHNLSSIPCSNSVEKSQCFPSLRKLSIIDCPMLTNFAGDHQMFEFRLLHELTIDCVSFDEEGVDRILKFGSRSLRSLLLRGTEDRGLPDQLQHLTALSDLNLESFGVEEMPEWIGNLSCLETLRIRSCGKLRRLPSSTRCLTRLKELYVGECPRLKEKVIEHQRDGDDSEWPKISHVPKIVIDWVPLL